jgi:transglutaminase-like putative cysteine protease
LFLLTLVQWPPFNFENIHDYNTRQIVSIPPVRTRTTLYDNYFLPSTVRLWNSEPTSIRDSRSPSSLKSYYKSKCIKKPIYYYSGTRIGQILHMRLRINCYFDRLWGQVIQEANGQLSRSYEYQLIRYTDFSNHWIYGNKKDNVN